MKQTIHSVGSDFGQSTKTTAKQAADGFYINHYSR